MKYAPRTLWQLQALALCVYGIFTITAAAQVNSGSDGSDGAFNPTQNVTINMADHPTGIYQYTSVNIPSGVTVTFTPNANNTPVVWLVQGSCVIAGIVNVSAVAFNNSTAVGAIGGPGGFQGGNGGATPSVGQGPGGGSPGPMAGNASFATLGATNQSAPFYAQQPAGTTYGSTFCLPLIGGSGGGGSSFDSGYGGGGGGGAILISSSSPSGIQLTGSVLANGANSASYYRNAGGAGSGGAIRLVATVLSGTGSISAAGGTAIMQSDNAGNGRVRLDVYSNSFAGVITGSTSQGFQPIIIPATGQGIQLAIQSIGGISVTGSPSGALANPDVILPAQQANPMNVVVNCTNLTLNTSIIVTVHPSTGADIVATGTNSGGTQASSTATIPVTMPRGGGIIYAKCVSGVTGSASVQGDNYAKNIAETGWTAYGERFAQVEITAGIGRSQQVAYITDSGKRYILPVR